MLRRAPGAWGVSRTARWSRRIAGFAAVLLVISAVSHRFGLVDTIPFLWLLALASGLAVLALLAGMIGFSRIWRHGERGLGSAIWGILLGCVVLTPLAVSAVEYFRFPALSDVSTDLADPPAFSLAERMRAPPMNPVAPITQEAAERQAAAYPGVAARRYEYPEEQVLQVVDGLIAERGWVVLGRTETATADHAVITEAAARTLLMGFVDDVAVRVLRNDGATYVDMRSASRYGRHDLGQNARRIEAFMADLDERMRALAGS